MRAVMYEAFGAVPRVRQVPDPAPPADGVVIRVEATGLCRSDWHGWMGHDPGIALPHVPGHELAGVIEAAGSSVTRWRAGDRVTVPFICACGRCGSCAAGDQQVCENQTQPGFTHWGSFAEYVAVRDAEVNLVALPGAVGFPAAAGLGCRFATAFRALTAHGRVAPGEWVAVHGCGGVGLSAVMIAVACGARVVAVDVSPGALDLARTLGAEVVLDGSRPGENPAGDAGGGPGRVAEAIRQVTGGGAHVSLDALGSPATCAASVGCLRRRGRHVQVGLLPPLDTQGPNRLPMDRVIAYELAVLGSHGMPARAYGPMLDLVATGRLRPDRLVTETIGLAGTPAALSAMGTGPAAGVTIIEP